MKKNKVQPMVIICTNCKGTGSIKLSSTEKIVCPVCGGWGTIERSVK